MPEGLRPAVTFITGSSFVPGMDLDVRELLTDTIKRYLDRYCDENGFDPVWGDPLVGFADARSSLFQELRTVVHPDHLMPEDILPGATIVVSYYIPYDRELAKGNISGNTASTEWAFAYALTTSIIDDLADTVATDVRALDFEAEFPTPEQYGRIEGDIVSRWSQRHVAYIAGLGAFGKNNMLITDRGCCGRFYSVVTNLDVEPDVPVEGERCLFKIDGSCGACMRKCRSKALTPGGYDRWACDRYGDASRATYNGLYACGKCIVGMPCSFRDPSA